MALSSNDLIKISELLKDNNKILRSEIKEELDKKAEKSDVLELKDIVKILAKYPDREEINEIIDKKLLPIKSVLSDVQEGFISLSEELRTEHLFRYKLLEKTVGRVDRIEEHIGIS
jgi:hypothetical protein